MENREKHIALLRHMASVLRLRTSSWVMTDYQQRESARGVAALDKAVEALEVQIYA